MTDDELIAAVSREAVMRPDHVRQVFRIADRIRAEQEDEKEKAVPTSGRRKRKTNKE